MNKNSSRDSRSLSSPMMQIPEAERPYEKCESAGERYLTDAELLSIVLRSGVSGESALDLARRLVDFLGYDGLSGLYHMTAAQLTQVRGVGRIRALQLKCIAELSRRIAREQSKDMLCFEDAESIAAYYMEDYRHEEQEKVLLLMLDSKNHLLGEEVISTGTVNMSLISPREVFLSALRFRSVSIILLHNHPSGDPTPSEQDILITDRIRESGEMIGITLLDHIIIGDRIAVSLRKEGFL